MSTGPLGLAIPGPAIHQHQLIPGPAVDWTERTVGGSLNPGGPAQHTRVNAVLFSCPCGHVLIQRVDDVIGRALDGG